MTTETDSTLSLCKDCGERPRVYGHSRCAECLVPFAATVRALKAGGMERPEFGAASRVWDGIPTLPSEISTNEAALVIEKESILRALLDGGAPEADGS